MTAMEAVKTPTATLVDLRDPYELIMDGKVEGALNIPLGDIPDRWEEFRKMRQPIVCFCHTGRRTCATVDYLKERGIETYNGGGWEEVKQMLGRA